MYFGLNLKLLPFQYLLTKQKFEIHIGCSYEVNEIIINKQTQFCKKIADS